MHHFICFAENVERRFVLWIQEYATTFDQCISACYHRVGGELKKMFVIKLVKIFELGLLSTFNLFYSYICSCFHFSIIPVELCCFLSEFCLIYCMMRLFGCEGYNACRCRQRAFLTTQFASSPTRFYVGQRISSRLSTSWATGVAWQMTATCNR